MTNKITIEDFTNKELVRSIVSWLRSEKQKHEGFSMEHQLYHKVIASLEDGSWLDYHQKRLNGNG
jgi:hypothetical protein